MKVLLSPSLLSADFSHLQKSLEYVKKNKGDMLHIDVMDGHFVPNLTFGAPLIRSLRKHSDLLFDAHLMVSNPANYIKDFADAGVDYFTFHVETEVHAFRLISVIREEGMCPGISLVPSTPVNVLEEILPFVDLVLVMTVNPGFSGQKIIFSAVKKIEQLRAIRKERNLNYKISVDGGINQNNVAAIIDAGADIIVSGSSFFSGGLKI